MEVIPNLEEQKSMKKQSENNNITRREALKKTGKYAAATAAATFIILNPKQSQAASPVPDPGWGKAPKQKPESELENKEQEA